MLFLFLFPGCAPEPASITFDGGNEGVVVHARDGVPVKRAVVHDRDGKALDPQPYLTWSVDRPDVVALNGGTLVPVGDGVAHVEASIPGYLSASYAFEVELADTRMPEATRATTPYSVCPVTNYGNGVLTFTCNDRDFPRGLAAYLAEHGTPTVTAVSPLVRVTSNDIPERALVTTYLVVTEPL